MNTIFFKTLHKKLFCFIALFLVAALGSGLFLSLMSLPSAVEASLNDYMNNANLMDVRLTSTIGFSSADAYAVKNLDSVSAVMPVSTVNALLSANGKEIKASNGQTATAKISSIDLDLVDSTDKGNINRLTLLSGRYPKNDEECVVDADACVLSGVKVGEKITLTGDGEDILASLTTNEYKIVGTVDVPTYLTKNLGSENVGSGELNALIYVPDSAFITDNFTELYVRLSGLEKYNYSGSKYFEEIQSFSEEITSFGAERLEARAQLVKAIAEEQIARDKAELETVEKVFEEELETAKEKLSEINSLANGGDTKIKDKESEVENSIDEKQRALLEKKSDFVKISDKYIDDLAQYNIDRETFSNDREIFVNNYTVASTQVSEQGQKLDKVKAELEAIEKKIELNQQVVDGYTDPSKMPDLNAILNNIDEYGYDRDFVKYMRVCAKDTSQSLGKISLSQQQIDYASKKIEFQDLSSEYNQYKKIIDNYNSDIEELQKREDELVKRQASLEKQKEKIEKENQDILSGDNAISEETFTLKLELAELKIKVSDAKENKETYEAEYKKVETEGRAKIENLTRSIESNEVLVNNTDTASWSVSDIRSIQGYDSLNLTVSAVSHVSVITAVLALVLTAVICVAVMTKYAYAESADSVKLRLFGITKSSVILSYLLVFIPIYILAVLCGIVFTTYALPIAAEKILSIQYTIPIIEIPVPIKHMVIAAIVLVVAVPIIFAVINTVIKFRQPKNIKASRIPAYKKCNLIVNTVAIIVSLSLAFTTGGLCLNNYLNGKSGLAKEQGIIYDAVADFSFPMEYPDKSVFINTDVKEQLFAQKHSVTGAVNYDLYVVEDAKDFSKFITTENKLTDDGVIISERLAETANKNVGQKFKIKLPDGTSDEFKIIGVSDNTVQSVMYVSEKCFEKTSEQKISYNCAFLNFAETKSSISKIDEMLMKNAAISKVTSTKAIDSELSLNNSISNIILISVCIISVIWSALCTVALIIADKRKNHHL